MNQSRLVNLTALTFFEYFSLPGRHGSPKKIFGLFGLQKGTMAFLRKAMSATIVGGLFLIFLQVPVFRLEHFNGFSSAPVPATAKNAVNNTTSTLSPLELLKINPLSIPQGQAQNLPSIPTNEQIDRKIYGGKGDAKHLGGFTQLDLHGVSPATWKYVVEYLGVHSVLDVGCGKGVSTLWFALHGCRVMCAEGSHDAITQSLLHKILPNQPNALLVEHDFSRGPWWPGETFDMAWSVEFLEHVGINYQYNYMTAFRKCALLLVTSSRWGGWHHVEIHQDDWWIRKYESFGFRYDAELTNIIKGIAIEEKNTGPAPNGKPYNAQHIWLTLKVFVNPVVAALPQHAHLFYEHGCFLERGKGRLCGTGEQGHLESALPKSYLPLELTSEQDQAWFDLIKEHVGPQ